MKKREKVKLAISVVLILFAGLFFVLAGLETEMKKVVVYLSVGSVIPIIVLVSCCIILKSFNEN